MNSETSKYIWVSAAETSGDIHGANLLQSLCAMRSDFEFVGLGGPEMRKEKFSALIRAEEMSVMGFTEVFSRLPKILSILKKNKQHLQTYLPRCVVLIDAPDFHFRIAKMAYKLGIPVFYYISPKVWAWRKRRVNFLRKYVNKILSIIPFEEDFFLSRGIDVEFVGHPLMQEMEISSLDQIAPGKNIIGIMPGSRKKEISALLPRFARAAFNVKQQFPEMEFSIILAPHFSQEEINRYWPKNLEYNSICFEDRYRALKSCNMVLAASGTATLECALLGIPTIVAYKLSVFSFILGRLLVNVPYISLPNLIMDKQIFPEYMQSDVNGENLAKQILHWLEYPEKTDEIREELSEIRGKLGEHEASKRAAQIIVQSID